MQPGQGKPPPQLPRALAVPDTVVWSGTAVWLLITLGLGAAWLLGDRPLDIWFWTSLCGVGLGLIGYSIMRWQRSAARRGSRLAQTGLA
jgi:hypothetical protein